MDVNLSGANQRMLGGEHQWQVRMKDPLSIFPKDLHKGCYIGQELVTRTLHRGVVRKRIVPIQLFSLTQEKLSDFKPDPEARDLDGISQESDLMKVEPSTAVNLNQVSDIDPRGKFGKIVRVLGNVGLALVRLDEMPPGGLFVVSRPHPSALATGLPSSAGQPMLVMGRALVPSWWPKQSIESTVSDSEK